MNPAVLETVIDDGGEAEGEENGTGDAAHTQVDHASDGDADAGEDGQREGFTKQLLHIRMVFNAAKIGNNFESCKDLREVLSLKAAKWPSCDNCDSFFAEMLAVWE